MRIPSGVTDQVIYFVAVDSTDYVSREPALTTFTVYRSRNGGTATAMTTPTITEVSSSNMPGVYKLLLDEDMTIDSGDDSQAMVFHITHAGMEPVTREIELYRPKITAGSTFDVTGAGLTAIPWNAAWDAEVQSECADALTAYDAPTNTQMNARTLLAADYATAAALSAGVTVSDKTGFSLSSAGAAAVMTTQLTESYATDGTAPTPAQALLLIQQMLGDKIISGTVLTVRKLDGSTVAATFTLNDGTAPTGITRTT